MLLLARTRCALAALALQLRQIHRTGAQFRDQRVEAIEQIESPADPDERAQVDLRFTVFKALDRAASDAGLSGQLRLRSILRQADFGHSRAQLGQHRFVSQEIGYFHNTSNLMR